MRIARARAGNPWAEQGIVPLSEVQGRREYTPAPGHAPGPSSASGLAAARLQRSSERTLLLSHRAGR